MASNCDISDLIDSDSLGDRKVKRFRLTHNQSRYLMSEFARQAHPDAAQRDRLSREIPGLTPRQVQVWFQNRRAKLKRMSSDDRYRMMKSRALPDEFPILQTLHSYDLNFSSRPPGQGQEGTYCSPDRHRTSPIESHASSNYSLSSGSRLSCSTDVSSVSCQISPTSPLSAQLSNDRLPRSDDRSYSFSDPSAIRLQPLSSFYDPENAFKPVPNACMLPDNNGDGRFGKSVGGFWQSPMDPSWRRSIDLPFHTGMNFNPATSPQSNCSSEDYFDGISKQPQHHHQPSQLSAPPDAQVFNLGGYTTTPSNYLSMPVVNGSSPRSANVDAGHEKTSTFRKGHRSQRSLSQPPDFPLTRSF